MTDAQATAEIFFQALKALPKKERDAVLVRIARDREFAHDLIDLAVIDSRRDEPCRPFRDYLEQKKK